MQSLYAHGYRNKRNCICLIVYIIIHTHLHQHGFAEFLAIYDFNGDLLPSNAMYTQFNQTYVKIRISFKVIYIN